MVKAKWGTKRTCPKCGTRFYDLGKENPIVCLECENEWVPEPILKSRQPQMEEDEKEEEEAEDEKETTKDEVVEEALAVDEDAEGNPDDDIDLGDSEDVAEAIKPKGGDE